MPLRLPVIYWPPLCTLDITIGRGHHDGRSSECRAVVLEQHAHRRCRCLSVCCGFFAVVAAVVAVVVLVVVGRRDNRWLLTAVDAENGKHETAEMKKN